MTKTQEAYELYRAKSSELNARLNATAQSEFPVGSRVAWKVGEHQQLGRVNAHRWGMHMELVNERTKKTVYKDAIELTPVASA